MSEYMDIHFLNFYQFCNFSQIFRPFFQLILQHTHIQKRRNSSQTSKLTCMQSLSSIEQCLANLCSFLKNSQWQVGWAGLQTDCKIWLQNIGNSVKTLSPAKNVMPSLNFAQRYNDIIFPKNVNFDMCQIWSKMTVCPRVSP